MGPDAPVIVAGPACSPVTCAVSNGVGVQSCNDDGSLSSTCSLTMCNEGFVAQNGACVAPTASSEYACTSYEPLVLNSVSNQLTTVNGDSIPAQDPSGSGACYYYAIVDLQNNLSGVSSLTGNDEKDHDQDVVSRDHDVDAGNAKDVWHPYIMDHTQLDMSFAGARTMQLTGGSVRGNQFQTSDIAIDNFFLIGVYPKSTQVTTSNLLSYFSAWGTGDSIIDTSNGVLTNGIAFNPEGISLIDDKSEKYSDGEVVNYSNKGLVTKSAYSIVPLNIEASGGTANVPSVPLTNLISTQEPTTVDFRALDCGGYRSLANIYLLIK